jgi:2-polyprenyl-3-methyl-5-hydroxy-6-metoxy-1,4-benzoquinol methylase
MKDVTMAATDARAERRRQIERLGPWFHNLHLPDGEQTAPDHFIVGDFPSFKWCEVAPLISARLDGWRALDVGCNAGFYSFELARRGASVLGIARSREQFLVWFMGVFHQSQYDAALGLRRDCDDAPGEAHR